MKKLLGIALTLLVASTAQAGQIILPTTLDQLLIAGNFVVVGGHTFDTFTYDPHGSPPAASSVNVSQFDAGDDHGFTLTSGFMVPLDKQNVDYQLTYVVHGTGFTDATLSGIFNGNGTGSIEETLLSGSDVIGTMTISSKGPNSDSLTFGTPIDGPIVVQEDIILNGNGTSISIINQGFSPTQVMGVPEPASVISLATGIAIVLVTLTMRGRMKSR